MNLFDGEAMRIAPKDCTLRAGDVVVRLSSVQKAMTGF